MCSLFKSEERAIGSWSERKKKRRKETKKLQLHYLNNEADDRRMMMKKEAREFGLQKFSSSGGCLSHMTKKFAQLSGTGKIILLA